MPDRCIFCNSRVKIQDYSGRGVKHYTCPACREFRISYEALETLPDEGERHLISGYLRERAYYTRKVPLMETGQFNYMLNSPSIPKEVIEKGDNFILWLGRESEYPGHALSVNLTEDYPICYCRNQDEFYAILQFLIDSDLMKRETEETGNTFPLALTRSGWEKFADLKHKLPDNRRCFVAMSFDESMETFWENSIKRAISETGYIPVRIDEEEHNEKICDRIVREVTTGSIK